jgi:hypothetical protein
METALTDDEILHAMASRPASTWRKLFSLLGRLTEEGDQTAWEEPEHDSADLVLSYPVYSDTVEEMCVLLADLQVVTFFDWMSWDGLRRFARGKGWRTFRLPMRLG